MKISTDPADAAFGKAKLHLNTIPASEKNIHQFRVACKRLRAYLRLLPKSSERLSIDHSIRDLARQFAGQRDIDVQRMTLARLMPEGEPDMCLLANLGLHKPTPLVDTVDLQRQALQSLEKIEARWQQLPVLPPQQRAVAFVSQYRHCKRQGHKALRAGDEQLHRWRKREKYLLYQSEFFDRKKLHQLSKQLKKLAGSLGRYHDLVVLEATLSNAETLDKQLKKTRKRLRREKQQLHNRIHRHYRQGFKWSGKKLLSWLQAS